MFCASIRESERRKERNVRGVINIYCVLAFVNGRRGEERGVRAI